MAFFSAGETFFHEPLSKEISRSIYPPTSRINKSCMGPTVVAVISSNSRGKGRFPFASHVGVRARFFALPLLRDGTASIIIKNSRHDKS